MFLELSYERVLHAKHDIAVEVSITLFEQMCHQRFKSGSLNHEMHMSRSKGMTTLRIKHLSDGTIIRDRIGRWHDGFEAEIAFSVRPKTRAHREPALGLQLLCVVVTVAV